MLTDPTVKKPDGRHCRKFIMESSSALQDFNLFCPPTDELPETDEHYVKHYSETRNGQVLTIVEIGTRAKAAQPAVASDGLDRMSEPDLEDKAAKAGVDMAEYAKLKSKAKRVEMIREARLQPA